MTVLCILLSFLLSPQHLYESHPKGEYATSAVGPEPKVQRMARVQMYCYVTMHCKLCSTCACGSRQMALCLQGYQHPPRTTQ